MHCTFVSTLAVLVAKIY